MRARSTSARTMHVRLIDNAKADQCEFTRLLEERLRGLVEHVSCAHAFDDETDDDNDACDAIVLSGSSLNLSQPQRIAHMRRSIEALLRHPTTPVLGICFGMQLIASAYGGRIARLDRRVQETLSIDVRGGSVLLGGAARTIRVTASHQDCVVRAPRDFAVYATRGDATPQLQLIESLQFLRFGVQFHPERPAPGEDACVLREFLSFARQRSPSRALRQRDGVSERADARRERADGRRPP